MTKTRVPATRPATVVVCANTMSNESGDFLSLSSLAPGKPILQMTTLPKLTSYDTEKERSRHGVVFRAICRTALRTPQEGKIELKASRRIDWRERVHAIALGSQPKIAAGRYLPHSCGNLQTQENQRLATERIIYLPKRTIPLLTAIVHYGKLFPVMLNVRENHLTRRSNQNPTLSGFPTTLRATGNGIP